MPAQLAPPADSTQVWPVQTLSTVELRPLAEQLFTLCPWQKVAFGSHTRAMHWPPSHACDAVHNVPPAAYPEPSALQVVARLPSQLGALGEHVPGRHWAVAVSQ